MPFQWYRHVPVAPNESAQHEGLLKRLVGAVLKPWEKIKHYGKALVGGAIYYYGNRIFWGGETSRYLYKRYRTIFQRMGFVRQAILAYVHRITAELPKPLSSSKQVMGVLEYRLKQIGLWEYYPDIVQDLLEFGDSFSEIIYSRPEFRVIGIKRLEPDYMYIQRDPYGRPLLFISVIDGIPVTIEPYRMMHIKLNTQPGDAFGVGLIEGGMDDLAALRILEDLNIQLVKHNIYPHRVYMCPSNDIVEQVERKIQEQHRFGDLVVPQGVKAQQMMSGTGIDLRGFMLYYQQKFFLDVGVPMDMFIKGTGGNRSTAEEMNSAFNGNARAIQRQILLKIEWFCELVLASEGIVAPVELVPPELDKSLEFARRQEIRQMHQEGLISRDFAQELLGLKHPLNIIKTPEDFTTRLSQEKNWMEMFKLGLLTRPYAIGLLGHDVPENRPAQPQAPNFMMPMPGAPPAAGSGAPGQPQQPTVAGVPLGNPDEPEMIDPAHVEVVTPTGGGKAAPVTKGQLQDPLLIKVNKIGLDFAQHENINMSKKMEGLTMARPVQTIYIRKVNAEGEVENVPYVVTDPKAIGVAGMQVSDHRRQRRDEQPKSKETVISTSDDGMEAIKKGDPAEKPLKPSKKQKPSKNEAVPLDGDNGGIQTEPTRVSNDPHSPIDPRSGDPITAPHIPADPGADAEDRIMPEEPMPDLEGGLPPDVEENPEEESEMSPEEAAAGAQQDGAQPPAGGMPKPNSYFAPIDKDGKRPQFADVFGDNEYSIKKPQKHVERIKEEMIDAFGQKHKRIHERVREHHKPQAESDFIKKKRTSAQQRWMKKPASKVKQSGLYQDDYALVCVDIPLNEMAAPWGRGLEEVIATSMEVVNKKITMGIKNLNKAYIQEDDTLQISNLVAQELLAATERLGVMMPKILHEIYSASLNATNEVFVAHVTSKSIEASVAAAQDAFVERCIMYGSEEATKLVEGIKGKQVAAVDLIIAFAKVIDNMASRAKSFGKTTARRMFKKAVEDVIRADEVAIDIATVEFLAADDSFTCHTCKSHHMKNTSLKHFDFESCNNCQTVYRVHLIDEE